MANHLIRVRPWFYRPAGWIVRRDERCKKAVQSPYPCDPRYRWEQLTRVWRDAPPIVLLFEVLHQGSHSGQASKLRFPASEICLACFPPVFRLFSRDDLSLANVPELQVGPLKIKGARMMVTRLRQLTELAEGIDGVIGMDVLRMCRGMTINFETMQVVFRTDGRSEQTATGPLLVRLEVQGEPLRLVLDTGARDIFLYQDRVRDHAHGLTWEHQAARTRAGWMMAKITPRLGLRLGEIELEGSAFLMEKAPSSLPVEIDGFLGLGVLNARYVELDFEANMLRYIKKAPGARARAGSNENGRGRPGAETPEARIALAVVR